MNELGTVKIADDVVAIIASLAVIEVDGIYSMSGRGVEGLAEVLGRKNLSKGVKVEVGEEDCTVDVYVIVEYGVSIPSVARKVQENIIKSITEMTGLKVVEVNISVQGIKMKKEEEQLENEAKEGIPELEE